MHSFCALGIHTHHTGGCRRTRGASLAVLIREACKPPARRASSSTPKSLAIQALARDLNAPLDGDTLARTFGQR